MMLFYPTTDDSQFAPIEAAASLQHDWVKPELCHRGISFDVHMRRFMQIAGVKEEAMGTSTEDSRHRGAWLAVSSLHAHRFVDGRAPFSEALVHAADDVHVSAGYLELCCHDCGSSC